MPLPACLRTINTPLVWQAWDHALLHHPDRRFANYIVQGIKEGFCIGFNYNKLRLTKPSTHNISAYEHPEVVSEYLEEECLQGCIAGPFQTPPCPHTQLSSFGVIPKHHQKDKWRLILDLSSPELHSINDGIDSNLCSLTYVSTDDIARVIAHLGPGTLIAKTNVKHAYRQIPVHPEDRPLLGMRWKGNYYLDTVLPFGLRSALLICTAIADAVEWVVRVRGADRILHYIDDFIVLGPAGSTACQQWLLTLIQSCANLGLLMAQEKTEGPATCLTVLGIEFDTLAMEVRLPGDKLQRLVSLLAHWRGRTTGVRRDLESLTGMLQHASKVVWPGHTFLRRLYNLLASTQHFKPRYRIRLNQECQADIKWWFQFIRLWNGTSLLRPLHLANPDTHFWSDASGRWGCGAHWQGLWFQVPWGTLPILSECIVAKELFPVLVACMVWWKWCAVMCHSDNLAALNIVNQQSAKDPLMCHLLKCLFFVCACFEFDLGAHHTPGAINGAADALSCDRLHLFFPQMPTASPTPTPIPLTLIEGLSQACPDWKATHWITWFSSTLTTP